MTRFLRSLLCAAVALLFTSQAFAGDSVWRKDPKDWKVEIYPIYAWLPVLNASLPDLPSLPGGGPAVNNATSGISGAAFVAFRVEKNKWSLGSTFLWAGLDADTQKPQASVGLDVYFGQAMVGREILPDLSLEGGVRRMAVDVSVKVKDYPEVSRKPGVWDPLIGATYRKPLGKRWRLDLHGDGGGFGVGSDVTFAATGQVQYRFVKHFGVTLGYGLLYFKIKDTRDQHTLTIEQTMNGPVFGLGIYF